MSLRNEVWDEKELENFRKATKKILQEELEELYYQISPELRKNWTIVEKDNS